MPRLGSSAPLRPLGCVPIDRAKGEHHADPTDHHLLGTLSNSATSRTTKNGRKYTAFGVSIISNRNLSGKRNDIRAHVGAEIAVSDFGPRLTPPAWLPHQYVAEPSRLPLLCESRLGYQNLCQLVTQFKMREKDKGEGAATADDLQQYAAGLVCLTGGDEGL